MHIRLSSIRLLVFTFCIVVFHATAKENASRYSQIDATKAMTIASTEAEKLKLDVHGKSILIDEWDTPTNRWIQKKPSDIYRLAIYDKLDGKQYFSVAYVNKTPTLGGILCFFIDKKSGSVLATYMGK